MNPKVLDVEPTDDYQLIVTFANGEKKKMDISPYLEKGVFRELKKINYFKRVCVSFGSVAWPNEQDLSYDTLYLCGKKLNRDN